MANDFRRMTPAQQRHARSVRRVRTLVSQGHEFNPAGASSIARETGAGNARTLMEDADGQAIGNGAFGTASAPKGGPVTFTQPGGTVKKGKITFR
jgi:hypothetical protein